MYVHVTVNQTPTFGVSKAHQQVAKLYTYSLIVSTHPQCPSTSVAHLYQCTASVDDFCPPFSQSCVKPNTIQITNYTHTHTYTSQDYSKHSSCSGVPSSWWYQHAQRTFRFSSEYVTVLGTTNGWRDSPRSVTVTTSSPPLDMARTQIQLLEQS